MCSPSHPRRLLSLILTSHLSLPSVYSSFANNYLAAGKKKEGEIIGKRATLSDASVSERDAEADSVWVSDGSAK